MVKHCSTRAGIRTAHRLTWALAAVATAGSRAASGQVAPPAADPPVAAAVSPAVAAIQADLDRKQYGPAVRAAIKLLAARGDAAGGFSRFQVTMLKGDGLLGQRSFVAAKAAYKDAARATTDPHEQALSTWTLELLRRSKGTTYVPHVNAAAAATVPLDLLSTDGRRAAFGALLDDQLSALEPQVKLASGAASLRQIFPVVQQVQSLTELDEIANATDARTSAVAGPLLDHARTLMANALKGMWTRISDIHSAAVQPVTSSAGTATVNGQPVQQTATGMNGLTAGDVTELRQMIDTSNKIHDAATTFMPLAHGGADKDWGAILNDATRVAGRASDVLNANYSSSSVTTQYPDDGGGYGTTGIGLGGYGTNSTYYPPGGNGTSNGTFPGNTVTTRPTSGGGVGAAPPVGTAPARPAPVATPQPPAAATPPSTPPPPTVREPVPTPIRPRGRTDGY